MPEVAYLGWISEIPGLHFLTILMKYTHYLLLKLYASNYFTWGGWIINYLNYLPRAAIFLPDHSTASHDTIRIHALRYCRADPEPAGPPASPARPMDSTPAGPWWQNVFEWSLRYN